MLAVILSLHLIFFFCRITDSIVEFSSYSTIKLTETNLNTTDFQYSLLTQDHWQN